MGIIYKATNKINGNIYIGQTIKTMKKRKQEHISNSYNENKQDYTFQHAIKKYSEDNFNWEVIEQVDNSKLNERETYWIKHFDSYHNGYNCTEKGDSTYGFKFSETSKKKMSQTMKALEKKRGIKNHPAWKKIDEQKLKELWNNPKYSIKEIALQIGIEVRAVKRHIKEYFPEDNLIKNRNRQKWRTYQKIISVSKQKNHTVITTLEEFLKIDSKVKIKFLCHNNKEYMMRADVISFNRHFCSQQCPHHSRLGCRLN